MNDILTLIKSDALIAAPWFATAGRILAIVAIAWIASWLLRRLIRILRTRVTARLQEDPEAARRADTLWRVLRHLVAVVITILAALLVLGEVGVSVAPLLGAAGVAGIAIGFGAQSLVKDYFTGIFLLIENQIRTGDVVKVAGHGGVVEEVTLRFVRLRDYDGNVHFVPNGKIETVVNLTRGFAFAVVDVGVAYQEDVDQVIAVMREVGAEMRADPALARNILDDIDIAGVERWDDSAVVIRCRFRVVALQQWTVRRAFLGRLKKAFDARGIEIPFPHLTVYAGRHKHGETAALPLRITGRE